MNEMTKEQVDRAIEQIWEFARFCEEKYKLYYDVKRPRSCFNLKESSRWGFLRIGDFDDTLESIVFNGWEDGCRGEEWYDDMPIKFLYASEEVIAEETKIEEERIAEGLRKEAEFDKKNAIEREKSQRELFEKLKKKFEG